MKKFILAALVAICPSVFAANFPISSGASTATIQSTINSAAAASGGNTVTFAAGNYSITSRITIPCPVSALTIQGPTPSGVGTTWPITPTAILTSTLTNNWAFAGTACGIGTTFQYLKYNGGNPSGGGGGFIFVPQGMNNLTVQWNVMYGVSAIQTSTQESDSFIWLDGPQGGTPRTQNTTIIFNKFGAAGDCGSSTTGLMNLFGGGTNNCSSSGYNTTGPTGGTSPCLYQGAVNYEPGGGYCAAVGIHVNTDNLVISNNSIGPLEQGLKFFEGGSAAPNIYTPTNVTVNANDISGIHRIALEAQQGPGFTVTNNDLHDNIMVGTASWSLSMPQGGPNQINSNVLIQNVTAGTDKNGQSGYWAAQGIEMWGNQTVANNNLLQGNWNSGIEWGYGNPPRTNNNNVVQLALTGNYIVSEGYSGVTAPTQSGNVTSRTVSTLTSAAPNISPSTSTQTYPMTVSLTDVGYTSGAGPQGNTGIWYTTDGTTPAPGTGTAKYLPSGGTFVLSSAATVKAVGMWGALNQPASYPSGYGFVPSSVVSAVYTSGGSVTISSIAVTGTSTAIAGTAAIPLVATATYSNSTTGAVTTSATWVSSAPSVCTVGASTGIVTPLTAGTCNLTATLGSISNTTPFTVTVSAPTLTGSSLGTTPVAGVNTMIIGGQLQFQAIGNFSNGQSAPITPTSWASSSPSVCTVDGNGLVTAQSAGSCNIQANGNSAPWTIRVSAATLVGLSVSAPSSAMLINALQTASVSGVYSDGTSGPVTPDTWATNVASICTVTGYGLITAMGSGNCNVTASLGAVTSPSFTVQITNPGPTLVSVKVSPSFVYASGPFTFNLRGTYSDGSVSVMTSPTWTSANPSVGTIDSATGAFVPAGVGYTQITGSVGGVPVSTATVTVPPAAPFNNLPFCSFFPQLALGTYTLNVTSGGLTIVGPN